MGHLSGSTRVVASPGQNISAPYFGELVSLVGEDLGHAPQSSVGLSFHFPQVQGAWTITEYNWCRYPTPVVAALNVLDTIDSREIVEARSYLSLCLSQNMSHILLGVSPCFQSSSMYSLSRVIRVACAHGSTLLYGLIQCNVQTIQYNVQTTHHRFYPETFFTKVKHALRCRGKLNQDREPEHIYGNWRRDITRPT